MRASILAAAVGAVLAISSVARADVSPPEEMACLGSREGRPCRVDDSWGSQPTGSGTCVASECRHNDYSHLDDAGFPTSMSYDCMKCVVSRESDDGKSSGCGTVSKRSGAEFGALAVASSFTLLLFARRRRTRR